MTMRSEDRSQTRWISRARRPLAAVAAGALAFLAPAAARADADDGPRVEVRVPSRVQVMVPGRGKAIRIEPGRRGYLGVHVLELTPELRRHFSVDEDSGVLVSRVEEGSPAAQAGIAVGDVLLAVDGEEIASAWDLRAVVSPREQGDAVRVEVVRDGRALELEAALADREGRLIELGNLLQRDGKGRPLIVLPSGAEWEELGVQMGRLGEELGAMGEEVGEAVAEAMSDPRVRLRVEREVREREALQRQIERLESRLKELERRLARDGG
jgi:membrane-associated protease RseP (regulator of RpoE activity)